jgi:hypothetical protein
MPTAETSYVGVCQMEPKGRSGIGLLAFAVLAIVLIIIVATVAFFVGHEVAAAERFLSLMH